MALRIMGGRPASPASLPRSPQGRLRFRSYNPAVHHPRAPTCDDPLGTVPRPCRPCWSPLAPRCLVGRARVRRGGGRRQRRHRQGPGHHRSALVAGTCAARSPTPSNGRSHRDPPGRLGRRVRKPGAGVGPTIVRGASVPVVAWAGPPGARVQGASLFLYYSTGLTAMAPAPAWGRPAPSTSRSEPTTSARRGPRERAARSRRWRGSPGRARRRRADGRGARARSAPALDGGRRRAGCARHPDAPAGPGRQNRAGAGKTVTLATLNRPDRPVEVRFHEIGLVARTLHAVSTPSPSTCCWSSGCGAWRSS